jgi:hypothetical protein
MQKDKKVVCAAQENERCRKIQLCRDEAIREGGKSVILVNDALHAGRLIWPVVIRLRIFRSSQPLNMVFSVSSISLTLPLSSLKRPIIKG